MQKIETAEKIKEMTKPFLDKGFVFEYTHQKGGDSSCVYIFRYKKGRDYFDWREVSGTDEIHFVVYTGGSFAFPKLKIKSGGFFKTLFKRQTLDEKRRAFAEALLQELNSGKPDFFGIKL